MKVYKQTRQPDVFHDVQANVWFSKRDPQFKQMLIERKEGSAQVLPFAKSYAEKRRLRYSTIGQAEVNEALLDFLLWEKADKLNELKVKFDSIKEEIPKK